MTAEDRPVQQERVRNDQDGKDDQDDRDGDKKSKRIGVEPECEGGEKIAEALKLLEEAALQKKEELKSAMADKYSHLKRVVVETESSLAKSLADHYLVMSRGEIIKQGLGRNMDSENVKACLAL